MAEKVKQAIAQTIERSRYRRRKASIRRRRVELAKDKALKQFHTVRLSQLPGLWMALLADMSLNSISPLLLQSIK